MNRRAIIPISADGEIVNADGLHAPRCQPSCRCLRQRHKVAGLRTELDEVTGAIVEELILLAERMVTAQTDQLLENLHLAVGDGVIEPAIVLEVDVAGGDAGVGAGRVREPRHPPAGACACTHLVDVGGM